MSVLRTFFMAITFILGLLAAVVPPVFLLYLATEQKQGWGYPAAFVTFLVVTAGFITALTVIAERSEA